MKKNQRVNIAAPVGDPSDPQIIRGEVAQLAYNHVLVENERFAVVSAWAGQIPNLIKER
jgi:hypothetical protein